MNSIISHSLRCHLCKITSAATVGHNFGQQLEAEVRVWDHETIPPLQTKSVSLSIIIETYINDAI